VARYRPGNLIALCFSEAFQPLAVSASSSITRIEPLGMNCLPHGRKFNVEGFLSRGRRRHIDLGRLFFYDPVAHGEAQARWCRAPACREKVSKYLMDLVRRGIPFALVRHFNFHGCLVGARADLPVFLRQAWRRSHQERFRKTCCIFCRSRELVGNRR